MAAPELLRSKDKIEEIKQPGNQTGLPNIDRVALLRDMPLPPTQVAAQLPEVKVGPAPAPNSPDARKEQVSGAMQTLESGSATAQQKMEAVSNLYDNSPKDKHGRVHLTINDGGESKQFEISKEKLGHGVNLTHLTYRDDKGHTHPVLRGVERNGNFEQQSGKHGERVDFQGDWWAKHAQESKIGAYTPSTDQPQPVPRPADLPKPPVAPPEAVQPPVPQPVPRPGEAPQPPAVAPPEAIQPPVPLPPRRPEEQHPHPRHEAPSGDEAPVHHEHHGRHHGRHHRHPQEESGTPEPARKPEQSQKSEPAQNSEAGHESRHSRRQEARPDDSSETPTGRGGYVDRSELHKYFVVQPSHFECGSSAEAMALAKIKGTGPFSAAQIHQLSRENGTTASGMPHGADGRNMEQHLQAHGVNAKTFTNQDGNEMKHLDDELAKGHSAVVYIRNPDTGHGHFIFIAGKTDDNHYLMGNSGGQRYRNAAPVDRASLQHWMLGDKPHSPYFVSVW